MTVPKTPFGSTISPFGTVISPFWYCQIPAAEDALLFFFISQFASSYIGIKDKVYRYRINTGMTSARKSPRHAVRILGRGLRRKS